MNTSRRKNSNNLKRKDVSRLQAKGTILSCYDTDKTLVSVEEYRKMLNDYVSTDMIVKERLGYLEAFCKNVIRLELESYGKKQDNIPNNN